MSAPITLPWSIKPRPDTGLTNGQLGVWLFLASEVMLFGGLLSSYLLLRLGGGEWPRHELNLGLAAANTIILLASSLAASRARTLLARGGLRAAGGVLGTALLLGAVFLLLKGIEYGQKIAAGHVPATSNFFGIYFTLTGVHALHVLAGLVVFGWLLGPGRGLATAAPERFAHRLQGATLYWHFVDVVWIVLFVSLYLV